MANNEHALPHETDRSSVRIEPKIEATVCITFNDFTPLNDSLMGWLKSFLEARKEVKTVNIETFGFNQAISEVAEDAGRTDTGAPGKADAPGGVQAW